MYNKQDDVHVSKQITNKIIDIKENEIIASFTRRKRWMLNKKMKLRVKVVRVKNKIDWLCFFFFVISSVI